MDGPDSSASCLWLSSASSTQMWYMDTKDAEISSFLVMKYP